MHDDTVAVAESTTRAGDRPHPCRQCQSDSASLEIRLQVIVLIPD